MPIDFERKEKFLLLFLEGEVGEGSGCSEEVEFEGGVGEGADLGGHGSLVFAVEDQRVGGGDGGAAHDGWRCRVAGFGDGPGEPGIGVDREFDPTIGSGGEPAAFEFEFGSGGGRFGWCCERAGSDGGGVVSELPGVFLFLGGEIFRIVFGSGFEGVEEEAGEVVFGLDPDDGFEFLDGDVLLAEDELVVGKDEVGGGIVGIGGEVIVEEGEEAGVFLGGREESAHGGPVHAGGGGKEGIEDGGCAVVLSDGEEGESAELVHEGVLRVELQGLGDTGERGLVAASLEFLESLIEENAGLFFLLSGGRERSGLGLGSFGQW